MNEPDLSSVPTSMRNFLLVRGVSPELAAAAVKAWEQHRCWVAPTGEQWGEKVSSPPAGPEAMVKPSPS